MYIKQNQNQCAYIGVKGKNRGIRCQTKCKDKFCSKHKPKVQVSSSMPSITAPDVTVPETITKAPEVPEAHEAPEAPDAPEVPEAQHLRHLRHLMHLRHLVTEAPRHLRHLIILKTICQVV